MSKLALFIAVLVLAGPGLQAAEAAPRTTGSNTYGGVYCTGANVAVCLLTAKRLGTPNSLGTQTRSPRAGMLVPAIQSARPVYTPPPSSCATPGNCWPHHKPQN